MKLLKRNWTHWQWYKSFFSITVLRYFVIWFSVVPLLYNLFKQIPDGKINFRNIKYVDDPNLVQDPTVQGAIETFFSIELNVPFHWELLWVSSLFFVIALILYAIFCPGFIKKYPSFKEYKAHFHSPRWVVWEALNIVNKKSEIKSFFNRLNTKQYLKINNDDSISINEVKVETLQTELHFSHENKRYVLGMPILDNNEINQEKTDLAEKEIFWEIFGRFSTSNSTVRFLIIICLFLSLIFFAIPVGQNIAEGSKIIREWIF